MERRISSQVAVPQSELTGSWDFAGQPPSPRSECGDWRRDLGGYYEPVFLSAREILVSVYFCDGFTLGMRFGRSGSSVGGENGFAKLKH